MILAVVTKPWFSKSPWDSYTKTFDSEEAFMTWWTSLPEDSFTRMHGVVAIYSAEVIVNHYSEVVI